MALIQCVECGNQVSSLAAACPRCGAPVNPPPTDASTSTSLTSPSAERSSPPSGNAGLRRITLPVPKLTPEYRPPLNAGTGCLGGLIMGFIGCGAAATCSGARDQEIGMMAILGAIIGGVLGLIAGASDSGKPEESWASNITNAVEDFAVRIGRGISKGSASSVRQGLEEILKKSRATSFRRC